MRISRVMVAVAVLFAAATPSYAPAQVESTPIPTQHKPNFTPMEFMIGTWSCSFRSARRPAPYEVTSTYSMDPSGWWIDQTSVTAPVAWFPMKTTTHDKITWDTDTHRWVDVSYGEPNSYGLSFASAWRDNKIVWHDVSFAPSADIKSQTDTTVTKVSDAKMLSDSSFTERSTGRVVDVHGVCAKQ